MRRRAALLIAVVAVAVPGAAQAKTLTIQVTSVVISFTPIDKKPTGTSKGDRVIQRNRLMNAVRQFRKQKGTRIGTDHGTLTYLGAHRASYVGVAQLPDGTIRLAGIVLLIEGGGIRIPVTGGTGRYEGAKGTLSVEPGDTRVLNVYELTLPENVA
jgi:hypothetical protein